MTVMYFLFGIIALAIFAGIVGGIEKFYLTKYDYKVYKLGVMLALFLTVILFVIFLMGTDGDVSYDNMMVAFIAGAVLWVLIFIYNVKQTSILAAPLLTIFQSIASIFIVLIVFLFLFEDRRGYK